MQKADINISVSPIGELSFKNKVYKCSLGKAGVVENKIEGDGGSPVGCFPIREIYYRRDKLGQQTFPFKTHVITEFDAWCDEENKPEYNTHIKLDDSAKVEERFWRDDNLYDVITILGYNDNPPVRGKGSAIFMHVAREKYTPTEGCIALSLDDILEVLKNASVDSKVCIELA